MWCEGLKQAEIGVNSMSLWVAGNHSEHGLLQLFVFRTEEPIWLFALRRVLRAIPFAWVSPSELPTDT